MVNPISSSFSAPAVSNTSGLTSHQKNVIEETLSEYDSDLLTESDAVAIVNTFSEVGIQPGRELAEVMGSFGFDSQEVGSLANADAAPPHPPKKETGGVDLKTLVDYIEEYLSQIDDDSTETTEASLYDTLKNHFGLEDGQSFINITA